MYYVLAYTETFYLFNLDNLTAQSIHIRAAVAKEHDLYHS